MRFYSRRHKLRMQGFDYGSEQAYFVTICSHHRRHLFGDIHRGIMCLSDLGAAVWAAWEQSFIMRPHYVPHAFVVMPDHLHTLFSITRPPDDEWNAARINGFDKHPKDTIGTMIGGVKAAVTSFARNTLSINEPVWQSRFYDHVVRDQGAFNRIERYILNNPGNWKGGGLKGMV